MDKKSIIGIVVIGVILFGYTFYSSKQAQKAREFQEEQAREQQAKRMEELTEANSPEAIEMAERFAQQQIEAAEAAESHRVSALGESLVNAEKGEEVTYTIENDVIKIFVSSRGAQVSNVWLKDYERYGGGELMLYKEGSAKFDMELFVKRAYNHAQINTAQFVFEADQPQETVLGEGDSSKSLVMRLPVEDGAYIEYIYTVYPGEYMVDFKVNFVGMRELTRNVTDFRFDWGATTLQNEKGFKNENNYTTIAYRYPDAKKIQQLGMSEGTKQGQEAGKVNWLSFKQQFFSSVFVAENNFSDARFGYSTPGEKTGEIKNFSASLTVPYDSTTPEYDFKFYFGPNKYKTMKAQDLRLEKVIPLGGTLVGWINTVFVINVFDWLSKYIASFGLIILILTIMLKIIIMPLTYKSYMSSAKMRVLKPDIEEINARYPNQDDALKKQQATMALYKQAGVSPMGGCLPMLIQMPIIIALFRFFPASIELRGQSFLWAEDLSAYDSILDFGFKIPFYGDHISLFTLLMAAAMFFYSKLNYQQTSAAGGQQMAGMKFMTVYLMPILMLCWFNDYASGLTYYYLLSQLFTIGIMTGFKYLVNEDKLRAKLQTNVAKSATAAPKKKSKFQQRYEEALRQQQQMQRQQNNSSAGVPRTAGGRANTTKPQSTKNQPPKKRK